MKFGKVGCYLKVRGDDGSAWRRPQNWRFGRPQKVGLLDDYDPGTSPTGEQDGPFGDTYGSNRLVILDDPTANPMRGVAPEAMPPRGTVLHDAAVYQDKSARMMALESAATTRNSGGQGTIYGDDGAEEYPLDEEAPDNLLQTGAMTSTTDPMTAADFRGRKTSKATRFEVSIAGRSYLVPSTFIY